MLLEKTSYPNDFPLQIHVMQVKDYPLHYHQDIELIYVLEGHVSLRSGYCTYQLHEGDLFCNNGHEVHSLSSEDGNNVICSIKISNSFFTQFFPKLSHSTYRTYSKVPHDEKFDTLRRIYLTILHDYLKKNFDYKKQCIYQMNEMIKYLNKYFNLFSMSDKIVVGFESTNQITIDRISRIIDYIYANYADKITLEQLSEAEHLSPFYLSHLIHEYTGMSFRDFLCFARAERSEIMLLETDKKISAIAKESGFSTTAYYRKYFSQWFGHTPEEHRLLCRPEIYGPDHQGTMKEVPLSKAVALTEGELSMITSQDISNSRIFRSRLDLDISGQEEKAAALKPVFSVNVSREDYDIIGDSVPAILTELFGDSEVKVTIPEAPEEGPDGLADILKASGFTVTTARTALLQKEQAPFYGNDTCMAPIQTIKDYLFGASSEIRVTFRDQGDPGIIFKGQPGTLTSDCVRKTLFYGYQFLSYMKGDLMSLGPNHAVMKLEGESTAYMVLVMNYDEKAQRLMDTSSTVYQAYDAISGCMDELEATLNFPVEPGTYYSARYLINDASSIFGFMGKMGFPEIGQDVWDPFNRLMRTGPRSETGIITFSGTASLNFSLSGVGMEIMVLRIKEE
ncbi:MAG: helix-turn-helix transcriptional regulator [Firmicutes bacterium]|nr:helix-turn-helix transcriptional regulator [Bacillota bacterium]